MPMAPVNVFFMPNAYLEDNIPTVHVNVKYKAIYWNDEVFDNTSRKDDPVFNESK